MPLTALAFWTVYVGGICAALVNPVVGIALYVLVYHLNPEAQWWGASVGNSGLRTSFVVALATAVGTVVQRPRLPNGARQFPLTYVLALAFGVLALGSLLWGVEASDRGEFMAWKYMKLLAFLFLLVRCVRAPEHYQAVLLSWLVGVLYLGYQARGGVGHVTEGRLSTGIGGPDFAESSGLAVHVVATLPLIGAVFFMCRTWLGRGFVLLTGAFAVDTIIMTRTRNAVVGLVVAAAACVLALPRGYRVKGLLAVIFGAVLAVQLTDPAWWRRMDTISNYTQDVSANSRLTFWKAALSMVDDYPFGIGLGNFHHTVMKYVPGLTITRAAHSTLLACLAELGWLGLALFLGIIAVTVWRLGQVRRIAAGQRPSIDIQLHRWKTRFHLGWHAVALRAAILGYLGCAMFTTRLFSEDLWLLLGLAMCLHNISRSMEAEESAFVDDRPLAVSTPEVGFAPPARPGGSVPGLASGPR